MKIRKEKKRKGENKFSFEFYSYYSNKVGCLPPLTMEAEQKKKKCKSCGSIDHKSIYSQECPNHIPLHERARDSTNRMSLAGRLKDKRCLQVINTALDAFHTLHYYSSLFIIGHDIRVMSQGFQPPIVTETYLHSVWSLLRPDASSKSESTKPTSGLLETARQLNLPLINCTGLAQLLSANKSLIMKDYTNHNTSDIIEKHIAMYVRAKYDVARGHSSAIAEKIVTKKPGQFKTLPKTLDGTVEQWNQRIKELHEEYMELAHEWVVSKDKDGEEKKTFKLTCVKVQLYRFHIMCVINEGNKQLKTGGADYLFRQIKLFPTAEAGRKFANLDNAAVVALRTTARMIYPELLETKKVESKKRKKDGSFKRKTVKAHPLDPFFQSLESIFVLGDKPGAKMGKNPKKWRLGRSVKTNGLQLHITYETLNTERNAGGAKKGNKSKMEGHSTKSSVFNPPYDFSEVPRDIREQDVRVHDPGNSSPFTWTSKDEEGEHFFGGISKAEYNHRSKRSKKNRKHARDAERTRIDKMYAYLAGFTLRTCSWPEMRRAIKAFIHNHASLHSFNSRKPWLKMNFEADQAEQRAINHVINRVLRGKGPKRKRLHRNQRRRAKKKHKSPFFILA